MSHYREPTAQEQLDDLENHIFDCFNPRDDDSVNGWTVVQDAADFIRSLPCECKWTGPDGEDQSVPWESDDCCRRCEVLGCYFDQRCSR